MKYLSTQVASLLVIILLLLNGFTGKAQYFTIPDASFATWLNSSPYSHCMAGNQMDTLCMDTTVLQGDTFNISGQGIINLTGLRYLQWYSSSFFPVLDLSHNNITTVAQPDLIEKFQNSDITVLLDYNQIDTLNVDTLHSTFFTPWLQLSATHNGMHAVIATREMNESTNLSFYLDYNNIDTLYMLSCCDFTVTIRHNLLTHLPGGLITYLDCGANRLSGNISSTYGMTCDSNFITSLDASGCVSYLNCSHNQITHISNLLGAYYLDCSYNNIQGTLDSVQGCNSITANNNNISALGNLSVNLSLLNVSNNPLLQCIPTLPNVTQFELDYANTAIACLPRQFPWCTYTGTPGINSVPTCNLFNNIYGCPQYANLGGYTYFDVDTNCIFNNTRPMLPYVNARFAHNDTVLQQIYSDYNGHYSFNEMTYGTYTLSVDTTSLPFALSCPDTGYYASTVDSQELYTNNLNFGFRCKPGFDVGVFGIAPNTPFHPAVNTTVSFAAGDMSAIYGMHCAAGISGQVSLTFTGPVTFVGPANGALTPTSVTGSTITWNIADYGTVDPWTAFNVVFVTDNNAPDQAPVCFSANVTPVAGDNYPGNNTGYNCGTVLLAWDPNGKTVYPSGVIDTSVHWLTYSVHFKNTGSAAATNIYVLDTLDSHLDPLTFKLSGFNHQNVTQVLPGGIVQFNFPFINLPDSAANDSASTGFVQYVIGLKPNIAPGTVISNAASIYFDFNAPVPTNTVYDTIMGPLGILNVVASAAIDLYPNPASNQLYIRTQNIQPLGLTVYDVDGRIIYTTPFKHELDISALNSGVYFVQVTSNAGVAMKKFVKM